MPVPVFVFATLIQRLRRDFRRNQRFIRDVKGKAHRALSRLLPWERTSLQLFSFRFPCGLFSFFFLSFNASHPGAKQACANIDHTAKASAETHEQTLTRRESRGAAIFRARLHFYLRSRQFPRISISNWTFVKFSYLRENRENAPDLVRR